jgi:hypothetical protein
MSRIDIRAETAIIEKSKGGASEESQMAIVMTEIHTLY